MYARNVAVRLKPNTLRDFTKRMRRRPGGGVGFTNRFDHGD